LERIVRVAVGLGIDKVRLTGGEPLVRKNLDRLVALLAAIPGVRDIGLTTNGILLADQAQALYDAGLRRINISLDSLTPEGFREFTRRDGFEQVLEGIEAARAMGFEPIKINAVSVRGFSEKEIVPFGHFARRTGAEVRFIEYMPLDADNAWEREKVLFAGEILQTLGDEILPLRPIGGHEPGAPATEFEFEDGVGRIGFIASVSQPFCQSCNRMRVTADGKLRNCLFSLDETDLRELIRGGQSDEAIAAAFLASVAAKNEGHEINTARFIQPDRPMYSIGG
jgi:cyclic pyranopterin phosphate synthase